MGAIRDHSHGHSVQGSPGIWLYVHAAPSPLDEDRIVERLDRERDSEEGWERNHIVVIEREPLVQNYGC